MVVEWGVCLERGVEVCPHGWEGWGTGVGVESGLRWRGKAEP